LATYYFSLKVEGITKIRAHEVIAEFRPNFGKALDQDIKLCALG
jgi:hypothetical protein